VTLSMKKTGEIPTHLAKPRFQYVILGDLKWWHHPRRRIRPRHFETASSAHRCFVCLVVFSRWEADSVPPMPAGIMSQRFRNVHHRRFLRRQLAVA
jgi:hypothetical protein